jgi:hypothetical protein
MSIIFPFQPIQFALLLVWLSLFGNRIRIQDVKRYRELLSVVISSSPRRYDVDPFTFVVVQHYLDLSVQNLN